MTLTELISRLQYLATFKDDPDSTCVYVIDDLCLGVHSIRSVDFNETQDDVLSETDDIFIVI